MVQDIPPIVRFPYASWVFHPPTRVHVRLLGPCFKTGRSNAFCQHLAGADPRRSRHLFTSVHRQVGTRNKSGIYPHRCTRADQPLEHTAPRLGDISQGAPRRPTASPPTISGTISLSLQSSFHLSLAVLVRYRSLAII